jgi:hypothetical protein
MCIKIEMSGHDIRQTTERASFKAARSVASE